MISRRRFEVGLAVGLAGTLVGSVAAGVRNAFFRPTTITAFFTGASSIYSGDDVRVAGVKVGTITGIEPDGAQVKITLHVDADVPIPADAKAVIVAQNLVAAR